MVAGALGSDQIGPAGHLEVTVTFISGRRPADSGILLDMLLRGKVRSGIGGHAHWMAVRADLYEAKTGVRLYPGTLNVQLEEAWHVSGDPIRLGPPEYGVPLSLVPCTMEGIDGFIIRTDKNDRAEGDHPPTVVEIAAPVRLRDALQLEDGDEVEIVLPDSVRGPT